jgi:hypothetical protein
MGRGQDIPSLTRGLVGDVSFSVLPNVTAPVTAVLTLLFQLVCTRFLIQLANLNQSMVSTI